MLVIPGSVVRVLQDEALARYPGECCGLLFAASGDDVATRALVLENLADKYHALDPVAYPRTSRDAFMINEAKAARAVAAAEAAGERWLAIFHSHVDCDAYFSAEDERMAAPEGVCTYPKLWQVVIACHADGIRRARAFRFDGARFAPQPGDLPGFARDR